MKLVALAALIALPAAGLGGTCNLGCAACSTACDGRCPTSIPVQHSLGPVCTGGAFDLSSLGLSSDPPARFWEYDNYLGANSGCERVLAKGPSGRSYLAWDWAAPVDGCLSGTRTVAEVSVAHGEGSASHGASYLVASVDRDASGFDFDRVTGAPGCTPADMPLAPVAGVQIPGHTGPCVGERSVTMLSSWGSNAADCNYFDIELTLDEPFPVGYTEDPGGAPPLIAGYEVMYSVTEGFSPEEPTSSSPCSWSWWPVRDPADPARAKGVLPLGTARVTVAVPNSWVRNIWFATRLVYQDASVNPPGSYDPAVEPGPLLTTPVSSHCGAVSQLMTLDFPIIADKDDGLPPGTVLESGDPITYTITVQVMGFGNDGRQVEVVDVFDDCLDTSSFDPVAFPSQVEVVGSTYELDWDPARRELRVLFTSVLGPPSEVTITIEGLRVLRGDPMCRNQATVSNCRVSAPTFATDTLVIGSPDCPLDAGPVTGLKAVKLGEDVSLTWDPPLHPAADHVNVWAVVSGEASQIPLASRFGLALYPSDIRSACPAVPVSLSSCEEFRAVTRAPALVFYQARVGCADGSEVGQPAP